MRHRRPAPRQPLQVEDHVADRDADAGSPLPTENIRSGRFWTGKSAGRWLSTQLVGAGSWVSSIRSFGQLRLGKVGPCFVIVGWARSSANWVGT